ncbi:MAG: phosphoribosylamine--glycine ligase [Calditrichaeota bacterium]|nr:phosphoribosylamine--glycine ligase [Calditrichota bacterium]
MRFLVIGNGGREHAIIDVLQKNQANEIHCIPGIDAIQTITNHQLDITDFPELANYAITHSIDYTIVGPEAPLVNGIVDFFRTKKLAIFGPDKAAAQIEASKAFSKEFMERYHIPTASYKRFTNYDDAVSYIENTDTFPIVIKASGLAAGKGVVIPNSRAEAKTELAEMMLDKKFGDAADEIVIESFLEGEEASVFAVCDGKNYLLLSPAQDHKRIGEGDTGKNTGGMGAYAPAPVVTDRVMKRVESDILVPFLKGMQNDGHPYTGVLFIGLMIKNDAPSVVEFNCRFGDPETQVVLPLLETELAEIIQACCCGQLNEVKLRHSNKSAMTVVIASGGYPDDYKKGLVISGLDQLKGVEIRYAGTRIENGHLLSNGGRVLNLIAIEDSFEQCAEKIYSQIDLIRMQDKYYRHDIGHRVLKH